MVDCGNPRCLQEKRHLKKELLSWGKKIPYAIGLELVAESLAGSGKIKTLLLPFNDLEPKAAKDWSPACNLADPQTAASAAAAASAASNKTCAFCDGLPTAATLLPGDSQSPSTAGCRSEAEQAPMTPESSADYESTGTFGFATMATSANVASLSLSAMHLPTHIDSDPDSPLDLSSSAAKRCCLPPPASLEHKEVVTGDAAVDTRSASELRVPEVHRVKKKKELPCNNDSSGASPGSPLSGSTGATAAAAAVAAAAAAAAAAALPAGCGKRAYTELELRAAVEAIQSGAVGTRRAAQMYGVPRSTLRNKVFKAAEMGQACSPPPAVPGTVPYAVCGAAGGDLAALARAHAGVTTAAEAAAAANGSATLPQQQQQPAAVKEEPASVTGCSAGGAGRIDDDEAWAKKLQHLRHKHNLGAVRSGGVPANALEAFGNIPFGYFGFNPFFLNPYAFDYSYAAAAAAAATSGLLMPYIPDLVKNLTHKRLELERTRCATGAAAVPPSSSPPQQQPRPLQQQQQVLLLASGSGAKPEARAGGGCVAAHSDEDLRVPLYRPAAAGDGAATCSRHGSERSSSPAEEGVSPASATATTPLSGPARPVSGGAQRNGLTVVAAAPVLNRHPLLKGSVGGAAATAVTATDAPLNLSSAAGRGGSAGSASFGDSGGRGTAASVRRGSKRQPEDDSSCAAGGVSSAASSSSSTTSSSAAAAAALGGGPSAAAAQPGGGTGGPKNKRPKRGQYRKYDSELLAQAVRAVQRGEMSVHRAGTYFGVPHSTLEYKVKERHLLRKKKLAAESAARSAAAKRSSDGGDVQAAALLPLSAAAALQPPGSAGSEAAAAAAATAAAAVVAVANGTEADGSDGLAVAACSAGGSGSSVGLGAGCRSAAWAPAVAAPRSVGSSGAHRSPSSLPPPPPIADDSFCSSGCIVVDAGSAAAAAELPAATTAASLPPTSAVSLSPPGGGFALSTPASELLKKLQACANGRSLALPRAATRSQESAAAASATVSTASVDVQ